MTNEMKLLATIGLLPVLADFIEDLNDQNLLSRDMKLKLGNVMNQIRTIDKRVMDSADARVIEEQINMQMAFRQWLTKAEEL
jgi:hypothetical protein